ncbi:hypothetical protein F5X68DRAFT_237637 [Plectosphaerella plurivora]|uniref:BZIP domain-containing protein n=1 Tax=Plectosphaerella plurivora TaxID=936078 RepID=A0A9P8V1I5_9PEZI|nr:hypothetical protein F5X68DRAFT_237637 [Plectosphaerella plurivora]
MAQRDLLYSEGFGRGLASDAVLSSHIQGAFSNSTLFLPDQQHQTTTGDLWGNSLDYIDTTGIMSPASSTANKSPLDLNQAMEPTVQPQATKKVKISLPSPTTPTSHASSQEPPSVKNLPRDADTSDSPKQRRNSLLQTSPENHHQHTGDKVDRRRDRNREAAQKCRTRKQHSTQRLVADVAAAEAINDSLRRESNGLREETLLLKNMVLQHGDCDCDYIQTYIKNAASRLAVGDGCLAAESRSPDSGPGDQYTQEHAPDKVPRPW